MQFEGEVQPCPHDFHQTITSQNTPERIADVAGLIREFPTGGDDE